MQIQPYLNGAKTKITCKQKIKLYKNYPIGWKVQKKNSKIIYDVPRHTLECTENKIWNKNEIISKKTSKNTYLIKNKLKIHMKPRMWWHLTQNTNINN